MAGRGLRVLIADDHPAVRSGIRRELEKERSTVPRFGHKLGHIFQN